MDFIYLVGWLCTGALGGYLLWRKWVKDFETYRCVTPRAIAGITLVSLGGVITLIIAGLSLLAMHLIDSTASNWWSRPICRNREQ